MDKPHNNHAADFYNTVWHAMRDGNIPRLEELTHLSSFPKGTDGWLGSHWLSTAVGTGNILAIEWVLSKKPAVSYVGADGFCVLKTALQLECDAVSWADKATRLSPEEAANRVIHIISLLVRNGADINQALSLDATPLHAAAAWSSPAVVRHLLTLGADPNRFDADFEPNSPACIARDCKRHDVEKILRDAMEVHKETTRD